MRGSPSSSSGPAAGSRSTPCAAWGRGSRRGGQDGGRQLAHLVTRTVGSGRFGGTLQEGADQMRLALVKTGTGTQTLSGANAYAGGTAVTQGVLLATNAAGSSTGTGPVTVAKGDATQGGTGRVGGLVALDGGTVQAGGIDTAAPTRTDVLTLAGGLAFDGTAALRSTVGQTGGTGSADRVRASPPASRPDD